MLSKNNFKELLKQEEPKKQRFAIRKLTIGVASVLVGLTITGISASADTATMNTNANNQQAASETTVDTNSNNQQTSSVAQTSTDKSETVNETNSVVLHPNSQQGETVQTDNCDNVSPNITTMFATITSSKDNLNSDYTVDQNGVANISTYGQFSKAFVDSNVKTMNLTDNIDFTGLKEHRGLVGVRVTGEDADIKGGLYTGGVSGGWDMTALGFQTAGGLGAYELGTAHNTSTPYPSAPRALTIEGNGHTLNMGKWWISLWDKGGNNKWDLTLKDLTINSDGASHSPFYFYQDKTAAFGAKGGNITFDGVTANVNGSPLFAYGKTAQAATQKPVNVTLKGNDNFNVNMNTGDSAISAFNINVADNANINFNVKDPLQPGLLSSYDTFTTNGSGDNAIYLGNANEDGTLDDPASQGNFTMGKNSKLVFNKGIDRIKEGHNLRFLYGQNYHGNIVLEQGATLDLTMGSGHSVAIQAGNLQIDKDATLSIDTWQNNNKWKTTQQALRPTNDYYHYGPITLGMPCANYFGTVTIPSAAASYTANIDGTLRIIRNIPKNHGYEGVSPLIVYGNMYPNSGSKFYFNVGKGGTLDLQDSLSTAYANHALITTDLSGLKWIDSNIDNVNFAGMITMFGTSSENHIKFDSPKYINFQRIGDQIGSAIRTEGVTNDITVTGSNKALITIAQWNKGNDSDTPNGAWQITDMYNQMNGGNYYGNYLPVGEKQGINHTFGYNMASSNSTVTMAPSMGGYTYSNGSYYYTDPTTGQKKKISPSELKSFGLTTFTNQFNWWSPRRIALYSAGQEPIKTTDADKYQPETQEVTTHVGTKMAKINLQDGIKALLNGDGSVYQDHAMIIGANSAIDWTKSKWGFDWAQTPWDATTDVSKLNKVQQEEYQVYKGMADTVAKTDKNGGLLATNDQDTLQVATIVYQDGSVDFVFVPIKVAGQSDADKYHFTDANIWIWSDKLNLLKSGEVTLRTQEVWRAFSSQVRANKMSKVEQRNTKLSWTGEINSSGLTEPQTVTLTFGDGSTTNVKVAFLVLQLPDFKPVFFEPGKQSQSINDYLNLKENPTDGDIIGWTNAPSVPDQPGMYTVWVNLKYQVPTKYKFNRADTQALQAGVYILNTDVKLITGDNAKVLVTQDNKGQVTQLTTVTNDNQMTTYRQQNDGTFKDDKGQQFGVGTQAVKLNETEKLQDLTVSQLSTGLNSSLLSGTHYTIKPVKLDKNQLAANLRFNLSKNSFIQLPVILPVTEEDDSQSNPKPDDTKTSFTQTINYTYQGQVVGSTPIDVKMGDTVSADSLKDTIDQNVPTHYVIANDYQYPAAETNIQTQPAVIIVPLVHATKTITPETAGVKASGPQHAAMFKTVSRKINIKKLDGNVDDQTQNLDFERTATVDEVTGEVIAYGEWTPVKGGSDTFDEVDVPEVPGFTASQDNVPAQSLTNDEITNWQENPITISYAANSQSTEIIYQTVRGKQVGTTTLNGVTDQTVDVNPEAPEGYWIDKSTQEIPATYTFKASDNKPITIIVVKKENLTPTTDNKNSLIIIKYVDTKTGKVIETDTKEAKVGDKVTSDIPDGYYGKDIIYTVTGHDKPITIDVTKKEEHSGTSTTDDKDALIIVQFKDDKTGQVVKTITKLGKPGDKLDFTNDLPTSYYMDPKDATYTVNGHDQAVTIDVTKKEESNGDSMTDDKKSLIIINYVDENGKIIKTDTKEAKIGETVKTDIPDGYFGKDITHVVNGHDAPITVNVIKKSEETPLPTTDDKDVAVLVEYANLSGKVNKTDIISGKLGSTIQVPNDLPAGYQTVGGIPTTYTIDKGDHQVIVINVTPINADSGSAQPAQPSSGSNMPSSSATPDSGSVTPAQSGASDSSSAQPAQPSSGSVTPSTSATPDSGSATSAKSSAADNGNVRPAQPSSGSNISSLSANTATDSNSVVVTPSEPTSSTTVSSVVASDVPATSASAAITGQTVVTSATPTTATPAQSQPAQGSLPQTGNESRKVTFIAGLALASLVGILGLGAKRKKGN